VLKCMASRCVDWVPFLHYSVWNCCLGLANSVIALVHRDIDEDMRWIRGLEHNASTVIDIYSIEGDFMRARLRIKRKIPPKNKVLSKEYVLGVQETLFSLNSWPLVTQI
jgi:hypothetical protein